MGFQIVRRETLDRLVQSAEAAEPTASATVAPAAPTPAAAPRIVAPVAEADNLSAGHFHEGGMAALAKGDDALAFRMFARAISLIPRYAPSREALREMSAQCLAAITPEMTPAQKLPWLTRAVEMNPFDAAARAAHAQACASRDSEPDLTKMCFIFHDEARARQIHEEAYRRALEFVTIGGVVGDVLEFGVLGGWSARIFSELMRDILNLNDLHLFDSFEGLPDYDSQVDRDSYEIGGRDIWSNKMKFPADFLAQFGQEHHWHIRDRLAEVIRPERIVVHKGFFAKTLAENLHVKAAILHLDCDLYQSTAEALWGLHDMDALQDGVVVLFDDWNCNRANPNYGERRAWREYLGGQTVFTATPWFTYGYNGAAFILHDNRV
jgi:hypothetical protein